MNFTKFLSKKLMRNRTGSSTDAVIYCKKNDDDLELICCIFVIILIDMKGKGEEKNEMY